MGNNSKFYMYALGGAEIIANFDICMGEAQNAQYKARGVRRWRNSGNPKTEKVAGDSGLFPRGIEVLN